MRIEWVHGLEGSPQGRKVRAIRAAGHEVEAGDYKGMTLVERVQLLESRTADGHQRLLCGSSYGGLTAAIVAQRYPDRFCGLLLCAPALARIEPPIEDVRTHRAPPEIPTVVVHAPTDPICPFSASEAYANRSGNHVQLISVDDSHQLEQSLDEVVAAVERLLQTADG